MAVQAAVHDLYDRASSTSRADREHHREGYADAAASFSWVIGEAQAALQLLADSTPSSTPTRAASDSWRLARQVAGRGDVAAPARRLVQGRCRRCSELEA